MRTFRPRDISILKHGSRAALALLAFGGIALATIDAHATSGTRLGLELGYANGIDEPGTEGAAGGVLRLGYKLDLVIVSVTPEVGGIYYSFGGSREANLLGGFAGGRLGFGKVLEPSLFVHAGYVNFEDYGVSSGNPLAEVGLALDLTVLPLLDVGIHGAYAAVMPSERDAFDWVRFGAHAAISF